MEKSYTGLVTWTFHAIFKTENGKADEAQRNWLTFVSSTTWPARSMGDDTKSTFRLLHWAKQLQANSGSKQAVFLMVDEAGHNELNMRIAQCVYDHIMDLKLKRITFLGACRLVSALKKTSWNNDNMLLFLQRNILHWAISAGVLKKSDKTFVNWDNIYQCMQMRSDKTPATRLYNLDSLPCPRHLWDKKRPSGQMVPTIPDLVFFSVTPGESIQLP